MISEKDIHGIVTDEVRKHFGDTSRYRISVCNPTSQSHQCVVMFSIDDLQEGVGLYRCWVNGCDWRELYPLKDTDQRGLIRQRAQIALARPPQYVTLFGCVLWDVQDKFPDEREANCV